MAAPLVCAAALYACSAVSPAQPAVAANPADISGTWVAKMTTPMGEMEIVYAFKLTGGKITGTQTMPFGDSPIVDGAVAGNSFHFTVETESFGKIAKKEIAGKIVGDALEITPAMPGPPPGEGPGGAGPGDPPPGEGPAGPPAGGPGGFHMGPLSFHRGTPTPSFRAPSVDYAKLPRVALPALHDVPANGLALTPPMGWNSWNKFQTHIDDAAVRGVADAMIASGMKDAGYQYIVIDDGWQGARDSKGVLHPNPNFPDMKALTDYVHSKGLKMGIYSSPGPRTCGGFEGSYGHEQQDAQMYAAWGMDYLKYDWCSASHVWQEADMQAAYQVMGEALEKTGRPIVYALCQYGRAQVGKWGPKVGGNLWRTTADIQDRYASMERIGFQQSALAADAGPGHWNDPDMLEIGNGGMSTEEYRTHFSLWAMAAAPLIAGNDLRAMTPEISAILTNKEVIAIDQDAMGRAGQRAGGQGQIEIWTKPLAAGDVAVAVFNRSTEEQRVVIEWKSLGLGGAYAVRDLWAHADRGAAAESFSAVTPAYGVIMLRLSKRK